MIKICRDTIEIRQGLEIDSVLFKDNAFMPFCKDIFRQSRNAWEDGRTIMPVKNEQGEILFYLKNETDYVDFGRTKRRFFTNYDGCDLIQEKELLDTTLLDSADIFVFYEVEEYTWSITEFLKKVYPGKTIIYLDNYATMFWQDGVEFYSSISEVPKNLGKCMYILSDGGWYDGKVPDFVTNIYNSINLMHSLCWARKVSSYGSLNEDKTILLIEFESSKNGMGDIVKAVTAYARMAGERGWYPVVNLTGDNQYLDSPEDNMWEYYFEPLSSITVKEAMCSKRVISLKENHMGMGFAVTPYMRREIFKKEPRICLKQEIVQKFSKNMPELLKHQRVLGMIARGSDLIRYSEQTEEAMIMECDRITREEAYDGLFLATEESRYWDAFKNFFQDRLIGIQQKRINYDYSRNKFVLVSDLLSIEEGERRAWGEKYLFITYCLSKCETLLYTASAGTYYLAKKWREIEGKSFHATYQVGGVNNRIAELCKYVNFMEKHTCIAVYGTGYIAEKLYPVFKQFGKKIVFCDKKAAGKEYCFHSMRVISPQALKKNYAGGMGILITATDYCEEIQADLEAAGISKADIMKVSKVIAPETIL